MSLRATLKVLLLIILNSSIFFNISNASPTKNSFLLRLVEQYPQCLKTYCNSSNEINLDNVRDPSYLRLIESGIPLLQYYADALKSENLPIYYAVIPLLESGNIPLAESPAGAKGLWQLMPATAHDMGAFQNYRNDFRSDIYISTKAAVRFLRELHGRYRGSPELVLAAYNWGPANIDRYLLKNKNEASSIYSHIPEETKRYLHDFYKIGNNLRGLNSASPLWKYPDVHYLKTIRSHDAELQSGGARDDLFNFLNPNYSRGEHWVVPTEFFYSFYGKGLTRSKPTPSKLSKVSNTLECFKDLHGKGSPYFYIYITRYGDSISSIAHKFSLGKDEISRLEKSHPHIESGMVIKLSKQPDNLGRQICLK